MSNDVAVEVWGLRKNFGQNEVLRGLDLAVPKGKIFALLGQNGAGKTTMVRMLSTLLKPDGGQVRVLSHELPRESDSVRSKISMTGQYVALDEDLSGEQNLIMIARLLGYKSAGAKDRAKELLSMFDLSAAGGKLVKTYSGGMCRRLDIAASIVKTPELLFLDEPTTGLDPRSRSTVWDFIRALASGGTTVFLTTQYLEEADRLADLIALIEGGKIAAKGTPGELKSLVGRKAIKIRFQDPSARDRAKTILDKLFDGKGISKNETAARTESAGLPSTDSLCIEIHSISQANNALNELATAGVEPMEYSVSQASLQEVFLTFTGGKTNG